MFSVLPTSIQSRLPPLPSIRRLVIAPTKGRPYPNIPYSSGSTTPLTEADTIVADDSGSMRLEEVVDIEGTLALAESKARGFATGPNIIPTLGGAASPAVSGIDWRCGRQGTELLINALEEAKSTVSPSYHAAFERSAYIDAIAYLLKGLPSDLDRTEVTVLRKSLPASIVRETFLAEGGNAAKQQQHRHFQQSHKGSRGQSFVHRGMRMLVARAIVMFCIVWPYVLFLLGQVAHYERKYKVSENIVGQSIELANAFGRQSVSISGAIYNMGDGKVGQILTDAIAWFVRGVAGGFAEGVEEGWSRVGGGRRL